MTRTAADARPDATSPAPGRVGWLRFVPPVAALGTAFVLQTIIVTDLLGGSLAKLLGPVPGYGLGVLFGLSVASCAEGGAAYLMDLYDKHLLARDSVWILRVAMVVYVAGSGLAIHWWLNQRHLPTIMSWLLAGMSGSALFLWSRGARWRNREAMRAAGQIDPALPRLPLSAKALHPIRWAATLWLISWEPVATTEQARARYEQWADRRSGRTAATEQYVQALIDQASSDIAEQRAASSEQADALRKEAEQFAAAVREAARAELVAAREKLQAEQRALTEQAQASSEQARQRAAGLIADAEERAVAIEAKADRERAAGEQRLRDAEQAATATVAAARERADLLDADATAQLRAAREQIDTLIAEASAAARREHDELLAAARVEADRLLAEAARQPVAEQRQPARKPARRAAAEQRQNVTIEQLADAVEQEYPGPLPGRPTIQPFLREQFNGCSASRADAAIAMVRERRSAREPGTDRERLHLIAGAS